MADLTPEQQAKLKAEHEAATEGMDPPVDQQAESLRAELEANPSQPPAADAVAPEIPPANAGIISDPADVPDMPIHLPPQRGPQVGIPTPGIHLPQQRGPDLSGLTGADQDFPQLPSQGDFPQRAAPAEFPQILDPADFPQEEAPPDFPQMPAPEAFPQMPAPETPDYSHRMPPLPTQSEVFHGKRSSDSRWTQQNTKDLELDDAYQEGFLDQEPDDLRAAEALSDTMRDYHRRLSQVLYQMQSVLLEAIGDLEVIQERFHRLD